MFMTRKSTIAASMIALLAAAPGFAQQSTGDSTSAETATRDASTEQAQDQSSSDREMPEAATPEGEGLSDLAEIDTPKSEVGMTSQQAESATQGDQGMMQGDQRLVMLDVEGFSQQIYERGYRQGYIRGISDARERFMMEMQRARAGRQGMIGQRQRMESAAGGQLQPKPANPQTSQQGDSNQQSAQGSSTSDGAMQPSAQGDTSMANDTSGSNERGTIIVLPPGVTPETFLERLQNSMDQGG